MERKAEQCHTEIISLKDELVECIDRNTQFENDFPEEVEIPLDGMGGCHYHDHNLQSGCLVMDKAALNAASGFNHDDLQYELFLIDQPSSLFRRLQNIYRDLQAKGYLEEQLLGVRLTTDIIGDNPFGFTIQKLWNNPDMIVNVSSGANVAAQLPSVSRLIPSIVEDPSWLFTWFYAVWTLNPIILMPKYFTFYNLGFLVLKCAIVKYCVIPLLCWFLIGVYFYISKKL